MSVEQGISVNREVPCLLVGEGGFQEGAIVHLNSAVMRYSSGPVAVLAVFTTKTVTKTF